MRESQQTDYAAQRKLVQALLESLRKRVTAGNVRIAETHISWVLLSGHFAYKIKKSIALEFLDFSSLQARRHYCEEEIRLNRRLAPNIYLNVISIGGSAETPALGAQPAIEYAVRMRRFAAAKQMDRLVANNKILPQHIDRLAATIARFHSSLPAAPGNSPFGTAETIRQDAEQNFVQLQGLLVEQADIDNLTALRRANDSEYASCLKLFAQRQALGFVRECHGDLHLGNIVLVDEQPIPFDGIEFNPALRWIDLISEIAFTVMDLMHHQRADLACRFLNAYVESTGDYEGIPLLRFYIAYRAMVRAKVSAIRASQPGLSGVAAAKESSSCRGYLQLAADCFTCKQPALIITHGLPGSGKTTFSQLALERIQAIRLRSDVERKRLFGLAPLADSSASIGIDLYGAEITQRTYARLYERARMLLSAGFKVIVDAAFLKQEERDRFSRLAEELAVPFVIVSLQAGTETLRERIIQRHHAANDASEADIAVLEKLARSQQPLSPEERKHALDFDNEGEGLAADPAGWNSLQQLLK
jgi:uncharacterized protein